MTNTDKILEEDIEEKFFRLCKDNNEYERFYHFIAESIQQAQEQHNQDCTREEWMQEKIKLAEQEVMKRVVEEIEHWTPKQERSFYVVGVRAMTLDDHRRKFSNEILEALSSL